MSKASLIAVASFVLATASAEFGGCATCPLGSEVAIPASDSTAPTVELGVVLPDGGVLNATASNSLPDKQGE
jgi:hypothetical protein